VTRAGLEHIQESISINTSLSALNACIRALSDPSASFVPFRRSTLTWFLQDSLGGSAKTVFLATVSPSPVDRIESQNTLKYATFAKQMAVTKDEARQIREELKRAGASTAVIITTVFKLYRSPFLISPLLLCHRRPLRWTRIR